VSGGLASFKFHSGSAICGYRITDSWALNVELKDLDEDKAVDLIALQKQRPRRRKENAFIIRSFTKFLAGLGSVKAVLAATPDDTVRGRLKRDYEEYLRRQRGLSERTIVHNWRIADRFLGFHFGKEIGDLSQISCRLCLP
jgi:hypothetical protein